MSRNVFAVLTWGLDRLRRATVWKLGGASELMKFGDAAEGDIFREEGRAGYYRKVSDDQAVPLTSEFESCGDPVPFESGSVIMVIQWDG